MKRRQFFLAAATALLGTACRNVGIEELTARSPQRHVALCLDGAVQEIAQRKIVAPLKAKIKSSRMPASTDLAFACLSNETGDVLAYVPTYDEKSGLDNCRFALRDIASVAKIYVYAIALQSGAIRPDDTFMDEPMTFPRLDERGTYSANNYGGRYTMRALSIEEALAFSSNVAALQVYHRIDQGLLRAHLAALKFPPLYNLNFMPLGLYAIPPLVVASRSTLFARGGSYVLPRFINDISAGSQRSEARVMASEQIFRADVCELVSRAMQRCVAGGTASVAADLAKHVRAKTGSSSDAWCVMGSKETTCALWIGDRNANTNLKMTGGRLAAPLLADFYRALRSERPELMPVWD